MKASSFHQTQVGLFGPDRGVGGLTTIVSLVWIKQKSPKVQNERDKRERARTVTPAD